MASQELQEKVLIYQLMQKQLEEMGQQAVLIDRRYAELEITQQTLEDMAKMKEDNDVLINLGSGVLSHGRITDKNILTELGSGVFVNKDIESAKQIIEERKRELTKMAQNMHGEMEKASAAINGLALEIENMSRASEAKAKPKE